MRAVKKSKFLYRVLNGLGQKTHLKTEYEVKIKDLKQIEFPNHFPLCIMFIMMVFISSCLDKEEGCLDPNALNLDVSADVNANCNYPFLQFGYNHVWGDESYRQNNDVTLENGDTLVIRNFQFYVSNVVIGDGPSLTVFDTAVQNDGSFIRDDLTILSLNSLSANISHVNEFGEYDGLKFTVGYGDEWNQVDTIELNKTEASHPWLEASMRDAIERRYVMKFDYEVINVDTVSRSLKLFGPRQQAIVKNGSFSTIQANNATINFVINYERLLQDIDLRSGSDNNILDSILMNIEAAIEIEN